MMRSRCLVLVPLLAAAAGAGPVLAQFRSTPPDFLALLRGRQEVPAVDTEATGQITFRLINAGDTLAYSLRLHGISNVVAAHIHLAPAGTNGQVVAFLYGPAAPAGGPVDGVLVEGVIEAPDLIGPLAGQSFSVLLEAMRTGGAYVNVHTSDGEEPADTGPGDFPGGEVRGQIRRARAHNPTMVFGLD